MADRIEAALMLVAVLACVAGVAHGVRRFRPAPRAPWMLLIVAHLSIVAALLVHGFAPAHGLGEAVSTLGAVVHLLFVLAAVVVWTRKLTTVDDTMARIDMSIIGVVSAFLSWVSVIEPVVGRSGIDTGVKVLILVFPIVHLITIGLAARLCFGVPRISRALLLLVLSLLSWAIADGLLLLELTQGPVPLSYLGAPLRLLALAVLVAAAWRPSMAPRWRASCCRCWSWPGWPASSPNSADWRSPTG